MKLLILSASLLEIQPWLNQYQHCVKFAKPWKYYEVMLSDGHHVTCAVTGLGAHAAASTTLGLIQHLQPDGVVVCGTAGGLQEQQEVGDLLLIEASIHAELWALKQSCDPGIASYLQDPHDEAEVSSWEPLHAGAMAWLESCQESAIWRRLPKVHFGPLITSQCFPFPSILEDLMHQHDCMGIDMETFAVMNLGRRLNIPVLPLRVISNVLAQQETNLPLDVLIQVSQNLKQGLNALIEGVLRWGSHSLARQGQQMIDTLNLQKHPEGGWFRRVFDGTFEVYPRASADHRYEGEARSNGSSILYLLTQDDYSAWHGLKSDESWYFHQGDPLCLRILDPKAHTYREIILGQDGCFQWSIPAGHWFSATTLGSWTLVGCAVMPGYEERDFYWISKERLQEHFPEYPELLRFNRIEE